jgi:Zn-dependent protease
VIATGAVLILIVIKASSPAGQHIVFGTLTGSDFADNSSLLIPACKLVFEVMVINIVLGVFNLIPVPPLDGSHVLRHLLPAEARRIYDTMGTFGLLILVFWGGRFLSRLIEPVFGLFTNILLRF